MQKPHKPPLMNIENTIAKLAAQLLLGLTGGIIGCYVFLTISLLIGVRGTVNGRVAMFLGIVAGSLYCVYLASHLVKKYRPTTVAISSGLWFMIVFLLYATAL